MWSSEKRSDGVSEFWSVGGPRTSVAKEALPSGEDVFVSEVELDVNSDESSLFDHSSTHYCITPKLQRSITPVSLPKPASSPRAHLASKTVAA